MANQFVLVLVLEKTLKIEDEDEEDGKVALNAMRLQIKKHQRFGVFAKPRWMGYFTAMRIKLLFIWSAIIPLFGIMPELRADVLEMQNGDRYSGKVLAVSASTVVLNSEVLGKINVPRNQVASLTFGTNAAGLILAGNAPTNLPSATAATAWANTNVDLSAALRQLGANTNFVGQIRQQMLAGSPEAAGKYDEMVNGLLSGQMNLNDLRQQAQSSAEQLRELKSELGPEAGESLDSYLKVLDGFIKETASQPPDAAPKSTPP
jgi:hypothetical protein